MLQLLSLRNSLAEGHGAIAAEDGFTKSTNDERGIEWSRHLHWGMGRLG